MRIFRIISGIVLSALAVLSCSPLSKAQLEAVRQLTFNSDTVSRSPAVLFGEMADIRLHRGLYYALSLSSGETRYAEVAALAEASKRPGMPRWQPLPRPLWMMRTWSGRLMVMWMC